MNNIIVDSSVWISFLKGREEARILFPLLDSNQLCINDLILAELLPSLALKKETQLAKLLQSIERIELEVDWGNIIKMQTLNLKNGLNRIGIPDLIVAQNAIQNGLRLLSFDKHFELMKHSIGLKTFEIKI
jgi:predicted nucleic acid-binding protein